MRSRACEIGVGVGVGVEVGVGVGVGVEWVMIGDERW